MGRKKVLITGAASGIGRSTAKRFAEEGFDVCINDIQSEKLKLLMSEFPKGNHLLLDGSYTNCEVIMEGEKIIQKNWGKLDVLVNCAGLSENTNPLTMDIDRWRVIFDSMVNGSFLISQLAIKFMKNGGRIIHVTSIHGQRAERHCSSYSMAKAAINQYCRSMALDLADKDILINAIAPGFVNTPMAFKDGENELETNWFKENYVIGDHLPLRRSAEPEEIAGVAYFLAGPDASYITGQIFSVDGGLSITF